MTWRTRHIVQACPFCGNWSVILEGGEDEGFVWTNLECHPCGAAGPNINGYNEIRATEAWNIRGGPPEVLSEEKRGYDKSEDVGAELFGLKPCPFCDSRRIEQVDEWVSCRNCGAAGPAHLDRMEEKDAKTLDVKELSTKYWNERVGPCGTPGERSWSFSYAHHTIEGTLEAIEKKNGLEFLRIREEGGQAIHILLGDLPSDPDWYRQHIGWDVRVRTRFELLKEPSDGKEKPEAPQSQERLDF